METPRVKTKSNNTTPWRSPRGVVSGKRALDSFRKQKHQDRSPVPSSHQPQSPYPRELAALLSSRIDRYKRICPNIGNNLEQKVGLSPITLSFPSPKVLNGESKYESKEQHSPFIQSAFLESVLTDDDEADENGVFTESKQIVEKILNLSQKCVKSSDGRNLNEMIELSKEMELLGKKLQQNLNQMPSINYENRRDNNNNSTLNNISMGDKLRHSLEIDELRSENDTLKAKLILYQKQIEVMSLSHQKDAIPSDRDEAVKLLTEKLNRSMRQVEEGQELASMLRTALASAIQDRINLEDGGKQTQVDSESFDIDDNEQGGDQEQVVRIDEGEYDETLAAEYQQLWDMHRQEAEQERNRFLELGTLQHRPAKSDESDLASLSSQSMQQHVYTNKDTFEVDCSKLNVLLEEKFLSASARVAARIMAEETRIQQSTSNGTVDQEEEDTLGGNEASSVRETSHMKSKQVEKPSFEEQRAAAKKPTPAPGYFSWIPGLSQQPEEIHSAVLIF